ncbi:MAG: acetyl-CoA hydrolase/transferase C-terminal domain-containing protein [Chloroflexota bacterium]
MERKAMLTDWQEEYQRKFVSPEEAVKTVKSGDTVLIPVSTEPLALSRALMARAGELKDVQVLLRMPRADVGWLSGDCPDAFNVIIDTQPGGPGAKAMQEKGLDMLPSLYGLRYKAENDPRRDPRSAEIDVIMVVVSPPDGNGFCTFGLYLSHKKDSLRRARVVLAEVCDSPEMRVKLAGDNFIHVSEIDFFTEHIPTPVNEAQGPTDEIDRAIADHVRTIIRDGDTLELGPGLPSSLPEMGVFDERQDLGIHSPIVGPAFLDLVRRGIATGKRKSINTGKCICSGFRGVESEEDLRFLDGNPAFELYGSSYVNDIPTIASNRQMVALNGILAIDLTGQIAADSAGTRMFGGAGGQVDFGLGSMLSPGGASISMMRSTTTRGDISRIVPSFEPGTVVSLPWLFSDHVVTEYGIARLTGKSRRQRAEELIAIAHPDFREELRRQTQKLF